MREKTKKYFLTAKATQAAAGQKNHAAAAAAAGVPCKQLL